MPSSQAGRPTPQGLEQRRARDAWSRISVIHSRPGGERDAADYMIEAHKLPVRIMSSGLGQALAFLFAKQRKKKPGLKQLITDLSEWVLVERIKGSSITPPPTDDLLQAVMTGDSFFLRWATDETLKYLEWLNRFAEGLGRDSTISGDIT